VKPQNILLSENADVVLADFGILKQEKLDSPNITKKIGTPMYMSPGIKSKIFSKS